MPELSQTENGHEALVDAPHLLSTRQRDLVAKADHLDGSYLLDQDPCRIAVDAGVERDVSEASRVPIGRSEFNVPGADRAL
jgi:hypothetical protein